MTAVNVLARVVLAHKSGLPEDRASNDWAFTFDDSVGTAAVAEIYSRLEDFYNNANTHFALSNYIALEMSRAASADSIQIYDITGHEDGSPHGSPIDMSSFTLGAGQVASWTPSEVCIVLTMHANGYSAVPETAVNPSPPPATIRPRSRYRGRIYLGPINGGSMSADANDVVRPKADFVTDCDVAVTRLMDDEDLALLCVWSRADATLRHVGADGQWSIDNAFDTQRRRGVAPTTRTVLWP